VLGPILEGNIKRSTFSNLLAEDCPIFRLEFKRRHIHKYANILMDAILQIFSWTLQFFHVSF